MFGDFVDLRPLRSSCWDLLLSLFMNGWGGGGGGNYCSVDFVRVCNGVRCWWMKLCGFPGLGVLQYG